MMLNLLFPIADIILNPFLVLMIGIIGGVMSGMLGIGTGVIVTPALMMIGVPPMIAVSSQLNNAIGSNLIGFLTYWRQKDVDFSLAWYLFLGGLIGAFSEVYVFDLLSPQKNLMSKMSLMYVFVLGFLGLIMLIQNLRLFFKTQSTPRVMMMRHWMIYLPFHRIFTRSRTEMSLIVPIFIGFLTGLLTSSLGGGNGIFMMPILSYLVGRSSPVVSGTTLLAGFLITITVTMFHGLSDSPSDWFLVLILLIGSSLGSQIGVKLGYNLPRRWLGLLGSFVILIIFSKFFYDFLHTKVSLSTMPITQAKEHLASILLIAPDWALWMVKLAYNHPMFYSACGVFATICIAFFIELFLKHFIIIKRPHKA